MPANICPAQLFKLTGNTFKKKYKGENRHNVHVFLALEFWFKEKKGLPT
jgi:hypothetical protein